MKPRSCKDCTAEGVTTQRPAPHPGPRCHTHHRAARKRAQANAHARMVQKTYGLTGEQYQALYELQGRVCAICRRATGKVKRLAVDHDHRTGEPRGLLCGPCNVMIGRYGPEGFVRALEYLHNPPARRMILKSET